MRAVRSRFVRVVGLMVLLLLLVACERPFQEDAAIAVPGSGEPTTTDLTPSALFTPEGALQLTPSAEVEGQPTVEGGGTVPEEGAMEESPAATEEATTPDLPTNEAGQPIHVVRSGDTIGGIAVLYAVEIEDIAAANPQISDINVLDIGQEVIIPVAGFTPAATPSTESAAPTEESPAAGSEQVHIVRGGDTLYSIGLLYGFTVEELQEYNSLSDPNVLKIGDEVLIPPASAGE